MKLLLPICTLSLLSAGSAPAALLALWNFNTLSTTGGLPSNANQTSYSASTGTGTLTLVGWTSRAGTAAPHGISNFSGSPTNANLGDPNGQALALQGGTTAITNNGASAVFSFSMSGFENAILTYATQGTATGFTSNQVAWSTDGISYTNFGAAYAPVSSYSASPNGLQTFDFSAINTLDGAATAFVRITFSGATSTSGNNRLDNIQLNATAVPEPSAAAALALSGLALASRRRRRA